MELSQTRLLVGLAGHDADVPLIRYAAMLTRLGTPSACLDAGQVNLIHIPEVRFVHVHSDTRMQIHRRFRLRLREQVLKHFPSLPSQTPIGCDVLTGVPVTRLARFAHDFDSDLLLVGQSLCPPASCGRLVRAAPCPVWLVPHDWPPLVRRILVPLGLRDRDAVTLRAAVQLAQRFPRTQLLAVHVHAEGAAIVDDLLYQKLQHGLQVKLEAFVHDAVGDVANVQTHLAHGIRIADVIASFARRRSIDLIVMSSRGRSRLASLLLPSVAECVSKLSPASILILKNGEPPLRLPGALMKTLLRKDHLKTN